MEKKRKTIIFKDIGFSIDIQTNLKEVDFFDVTLNLQNDTCRLYKKLEVALHPLIVEPSTASHQTVTKFHLWKTVEKFSHPRNFQYSKSWIWRFAKQIGL